MTDLLAVIQVKGSQLQNPEAADLPLVPVTTVAETLRTLEGKPFFVETRKRHTQKNSIAPHVDASFR